MFGCKFFASAPQRKMGRFRQWEQRGSKPVREAQDFGSHSVRPRFGLGQLWRRRDDLYGCWVVPPVALAALSHRVSFIAVFLQGFSVRILPRDCIQRSSMCLGFEQDSPNLSDSFGVFIGAVTRRDDLFRGGAFKMGAGSLRIAPSNGDLARRKRMLFAGATKVLRTSSRMLRKISECSVFPRSTLKGSWMRLARNPAIGRSASWLPRWGVETKITREISIRGEKYQIARPNARSAGDLTEMCCGLLRQNGKLCSLWVRAARIACYPGLTCALPHPVCGT